MTEIAQAFSIFMNPAKMKSIFQKELPNFLSQGWKLTDCRIQHPRYKTYLNPNSQHKSYIAAAYHLRGVNKQENKAEDKILYVKAYLGDRSLAEFQKAQAQIQQEDQVLLHIEKYGMIAWVFPIDPGLIHLGKVMDAAAMKFYFTNFLLMTAEGSPIEVNDIALQIINYRPEIRCTFRYDLEMQSGNIIALFGKAFCDERGAEINRRIAFLFQRSHNNTRCFVIPSPIGYDPNLQTLWLEELNGSALTDQINQQDAQYLMGKIASCLADFHAAKLDGLEVLTERDQLSEIQKKSIKLQHAFPVFSQRIGVIVDGLTRQIDSLPVVPRGLIHGDFHIQQLLLLPDECIALFDFDELAIANPLVDVANFSADLYNLNLGKKLTELLIQILFNAYKASSRFDYSDAHFEWHFKVQLLTRAYRAYIQQKPGQEQLIEQFITVAESGYTE